MAQRVNPTRMELTRLKKRLKTAVRGHKLLKDKRDEMVRQFMVYIRRDKELREQVEAALGAAMGRFAIAGARMGEETLAEALLYPAREARVTTGKRNIMSVDVPTIRQVNTDEPADLPYGFAFTSSELDGAVLDLTAVLPRLIELAEVEKTCNMLADEIEKTRRRVNALEHVMIPEMEETIRFITMKLEENERGNLNRLMKVKEMMMAEQA
ncbi:V-type ATP synthase subunit D [Clostridiaceae bacterium NSJ-31]|uniref:V-type ATP synthase subunit D n=1 Tax=Ligaoa zhengdingensis TaxID=2763658 RepID=A0A926DXC6_9FIRM|nr:V-type ATP synthase subunit D [Ligaoa zhengdingensis]MBC8546541.1 V-type ATP synthase subunit D [Ligaoa zhengdingensis]